MPSKKRTDKEWADSVLFDIQENEEEREGMQTSRMACLIVEK
jgi:hypothetical protein